MGNVASPPSETGSFRSNSPSNTAHKYRIFQSDALRSPTLRNFKGLTSGISSNENGNDNDNVDDNDASNRFSPSNSSFRSKSNSSTLQQQQQQQSNKSDRSEIRNINNATLHMMNKAKKRIDKDRVEVTNEMRR